MTPLFRMIVIVLILAAPLTLWAIGRHFATNPNGLQEDARRIGEEVGRLEQALKNREEERKQAVQELLSQQRTLAETLQRFQELNQQWPDLNALARVAGAEESDEEIAYRLIIWYIKIALSERSEELPVVLRRLENDYQQLHSGRPISVR
jgi:hypothetical protein